MALDYQGKTGKVFSSLFPRPLRRLAAKLADHKPGAAGGADKAAKHPPGRGVTFSTSAATAGSAAEPALDFGSATEMRSGSMSRYLAWVFLVLIVGLSVFLCLMIGNNARQVLLTKQYEFAALLSDNLNHQIYRRFTLPTLVGFGRIALRQPAQYERLDQLVRQAIHGMNVQDLRIYDYNNVVTYTINIEDLGRPDLDTPEIKIAMDSQDPIFSLDSTTSMFEAFFTLNLEPGSFILRTTAALRIENRLNSSMEDGPVMGVLAFTQDITADMIAVIQFQRTLIAVVLTSCLLIFLIMVFFLTRAEKALEARVSEKERLLQLLHQHEKLAGMGRVIAGIAHEIRNPLGIICSSAQFLLGRTKETDQTSAGILQAIYDESRRLSQTVTDFLDYARPKALRQDPVDILAVLEQVLTFLGPELSANKVDLAKTYMTEDGGATPGAFMLTGDKDLLYRAFYNVLINAVQAVSGRSARRVSLEVRPATEDDIAGG
ncbi:MAG: hypothetical protein LBM64_07970, partial [Deltaproteobacteria bacterium]|nr:hypothetical protein [Deltaproteobacteria bacterium]